jgi:hypothetical protein
MALDGTIDYFRDTVFNYPTMAECYKTAAFDGFNKLSYDRWCNTEGETMGTEAADTLELVSAT